MLLIWFKSLRTNTKILIFVSIFLACTALFYGARVSYLEYQRLKELEKAYDEANEKVKAAELEEEKIINRGRVNVKKKQSQNNQIDEKLKRDEEDINNANIDDADIKDFITKHQR